MVEKSPILPGKVAGIYEEVLLQAVEQCPLPVTIIDSHGTVLYANLNFCHWSRVPREKLQGSRLSLLPEDRSAVDCRCGWAVVGEEVEDRSYSLAESMWQAMQDGREWSGEHQGRGEQGELYWELVRLNPIFDSGGAVAHFQVFVEDISARKRVEADLEQTLAQTTQQAVTLEFQNAEIEQQRQKLDQAYSKLKATQSQMLQREKMASIGQLAAGVAHEINNPMGFIGSNLSTLGRYVGKMRDYIESLEGLIEKDASELWQQLAPCRKKAKIDYLLEDSADLIEESLEGAERVRIIVQNLKSFSRVDAAEKQLVDINKCLEDTINIVWNEIKYKATLERRFGEIPQILCRPQELNQVFMNIIVNAGQAIENEGQIIVATSVAGQMLKVEISDNGSGIPEEIREQIFEPFFTTKEVGKGTGLGMSISYEIIKNHGGEIRLKSELGTGTCFTLLLPLSVESAAGKSVVQR